MTRAQALAQMVILRPLVEGAGQYGITGIDGLDGDRGQFMVATPTGAVLAVEIDLPPLPILNFVPLVQAAQVAITRAMRPFAGDCGRGFNGRRGFLAVGSPGFSANEGWV